MLKIKRLEWSSVGRDNLYTPPLWYFHLLSFLNDQEIPIGSLSNINNEDREID